MFFPVKNYIAYRMRMKFTLIGILLFLQFNSEVFGQASFTVSGTVYDTSKIHVIPFVQVFSTSGSQTVTDSLGAYRILVKPGDSLYFFLDGKNSIKYPVKDIYDNNAFDIAIHANLQTRYKILQEVTVFSDTYRMDSVENREKYARVFGSSKPGIKIGTGSMGVPGLDIGSIIEVFQFRKNKQTSSFRQRLIQQEQDGYVDYRFNAKLITRITGLTGKDLENYMRIYRPPYEFIEQSSLVEYYQYIIDSSKEYKMRAGIK